MILQVSLACGVHVPETCGVVFGVLGCKCLLTEPSAGWNMQCTFWPQNRSTESKLLEPLSGVALSWMIVRAYVLGCVFLPLYRLHLTPAHICTPLHLLYGIQ